jgi:hypothetical protein
MLQGIEIERIGGQVGGTEYVSLRPTFVGRGVFVGVGGGKVRGIRIGARGREHWIRCERRRRDTARGLWRMEDSREGICGLPVLTLVYSPEIDSTSNHLGLLNFDSHSH